LAISTVPSCTASIVPNAGTSSPGAWVVIWNLPPVSSLTFCAKTSFTPNSVSSTFGKLEVRRQRMLACACTMAGAPAASTPARPAPWTKERRSMEIS
jgi:hypothetical protein